MATGNPGRRPYRFTYGAAIVLHGEVLDFRAGGVYALSPDVVAKLTAAGATFSQVTS